MAIEQSPAAPGYDGEARPRVGFFTDTTVCIGCKACEVACKEWNSIPEIIDELTGNSYDNTGKLGANTWRHVAFVEQRLPQIREEALAAAAPTGVEDFDITRIGDAGFGTLDGSSARGVDGGDLRWLMSSDVCKHCTTAACLDVCPTGSLFKTEFATVVVQEDICNGCGYCVPACPYGVIDRRPDDGRVWKCTLCYDRLRADQEPACAKACPTDSIMFGELAQLRERAGARLAEVVESGMPGVEGAQLYGDGPSDGVDGAGSIFLLLDDPEVYGLPPDPIATTKDLPTMWRCAGAAAAALVALTVGAVLGGRR